MAVHSETNNLSEHYPTKGLDKIRLRFNDLSEPGLGGLMLLLSGEVERNWKHFGPPVLAPRRTRVCVEEGGKVQWVSIIGKTVALPGGSAICVRESR